MATSIIWHLFVCLLMTTKPPTNCYYDYYFYYYYYYYTLSIYQIYYAQVLKGKKYYYHHYPFIQFPVTFFKRFTLCMAEKPLWRMELQEKELQKDWSIQKKEPTVKRCLLTLEKEKETSGERNFAEWIKALIFFEAVLATKTMQDPQPNIEEKDNPAS